MKYNFKYKEIMEYLITLFLILSSGGNPEVRSVWFLVIPCVLLVFNEKKVTKRNAIVCFALYMYILFNSLVVNVCPTDYKELFLLLVRLVCCVIIASHFTYDRFKTVFINIIIALSLLSLLCHSMVALGITLPLQHTTPFYGAFYHMIGIGSDIKILKNRGIFGEYGLFQMYLNIAFIFLWSQNLMSLKRRRYYFIILFITLITTRSTMGLIVFMLIVLFYYIDDNGMFPYVFAKLSKKDKTILLIGCVVLLILEECSIGNGYNIISHTYSFGSRRDDNLIMLLVARDYPAFGVGLATNLAEIWDKYYFQYENLRWYWDYQNAMSSGLANYMAQGGVIFIVIYVYSYVKNIIKLTEIKNKLQKCLVYLIMICLFMEEPYMSTPFFLLGFFSMNKIKVDKG